MTNMWTFRKRYFWVSTGLLLGLVTFYYTRASPTTTSTTATQQRDVKGQIDRLIKPGAEVVEQLYDGVIDATNDDKNYDSLPESREQFVAADETNSRESAVEIADESGEKQLTRKSNSLEDEINIDQKTNISLAKPKDNTITNQHVTNNSTTRGLQQGILSKENKNIPSISISKKQNSVKVGTAYLKRDQTKLRNEHTEQAGEGVPHRDQQRAPDRGTVSKKLRERLVEYCNPPYIPVEGEEGRLSSGSYRLRSVHLIMRHGDRTPMLDLKYPTITWEPTWQCDLEEASKNLSFTLLADFIASVTLSRQDETPGHKVAMFLQQLPVGVFSKVCLRAQMTPEGWMQQILLGEHMRAAYRGALLSKSATWRDPALPVTIFSTGNARTQQSAFAFMWGLLPGLQHEDGSRVQLVRGCNFCKGILCNCPAVIQLQGIKDATSGRRQKGDKHIAEVRLEIENILMPTATKADRKRVIPGISGLKEMLISSLCHNISLPCGPDRCITPDLVEKLVKYTDAMTEELRADEDGPPFRHARMDIHPLLSEIMRDMKVMSNKGHDPHFKLYSGHDITVSSLLDALGVPNHHTPHYASHMVFELWTDRFMQNYVRILYNGKDQMKYVRFCRGKVNKDGLCPLQYFVSFVKYDNMQYFNTDSYAEACQLNFKE